MAKKNKNQRRGPQSTAATPPLPKQRNDKKKHATHGQPTRETIESLVIAFVLAFLFRTFQAEAFVIPTGSMAPTLMGRHEDVQCDQCGLRYKVSDSEMRPGEVKRHIDADYRRGLRKTPRQILQDNACVAGQCPNCRHTMLFQPDLVEEQKQAQPQSAYSGDRILVNKYLYSFSDPQRWDVVVFKYPGDAVQNYIKRLVGLPGEQLRIQQGDVFARTTEDQPYEILRKPADKILAMRQLVHSTDFDPTPLRKAGYRLRWQSDAESTGWQVEEEYDANLVAQTYQLAPTDQTAWLRYQHVPPDQAIWRKALSGNLTASGQPGTLAATPELITDYNAYNTAIKLGELGRRKSLALPNKDRGVHWVGDLILESDVEFDSDSGVFVLELVESGCHFRCSIDVGTGQATVTATEFESDTPNNKLQSTADTRIRGAGKHSLRLANVDDQIVLWVDGDVVQFDTPLTFDATQLIAARDDLIPRSSSSDPGDLAPAAVGGRDLKATVTRLAVFRDIYYIADKSPSSNVFASDYQIEIVGNEFLAKTAEGFVSLDELRSDPDTWSAYRSRQSKNFSLKSKNDEQLLFVMGDNSAASSDARLWSSGNGGSGIPGGHYLERKHLIGKAVCVYWPHSFGRVPGTPIPFPFFPNFGDMRLVR